MQTRHLKIQHVKKVNNTKVRKYCIQFLVFFPTHTVLTLSPQPFTSHHFTTHINFYHKVSFLLPSLHCTSLHFISFHFATLLDDFHFILLRFSTLLDDFQFRFQLSLSLLLFKNRARKGWQSGLQIPHTKDEHNFSNTHPLPPNLTQQMKAYCNNNKNSLIRISVLSLRLYLGRGSGSVVCIATGYGLGGPGSNSGVSEIFRTCPDRLWGPPILLYN